MCRILRLTLATLILALAWQGAAADTDAAPDDPGLVEQVIRLLDNDLDSSVVSAWLDRQPARPGSLSVDDLIALEQAGASKELVRKMIEMSGEASAPAAPTQPEPSNDAPRATRSEPASNDVELTLALTYKPRSETDDDFPDEPDLYVYLDGEPVAAVASQAGKMRSEPVKVTTSVSPGPHSIRLVRERHERRGRKPDSPWRHEATACPEAIDFTVDGDRDLRIEIAWHEPTFVLRETGALSWTILSGDEEIAAVEDIGTPKSDWPEVCEDIEASLEEGREPGKRTRRRLERCVRWGDLWEERAENPGRAEIIAGFERVSKD